MAPQTNFLFCDPTSWQGSPEKNLSGNANFPVHQAQLGGSAMDRDPSSQSTNTTGTNNSGWTDFTEASGTSTTSFLTQDLEFAPDLKLEGMVYDYATMGYEDQFSGEQSPVAEQANSLEGMTLGSYQTPSGHISRGSQLATNSLPTIPRNYPYVFERSLAPEEANSYGMNNYRTEATQSMSRTSNSSNSLGVYQPPYLPSNSQNGYTTAQSGEEHTPSSLGWEPQTELVEKYDLILNKNKHYLQIIKESDVTYNTPARVYLDTDSTTHKGVTHCLWPGKCSRQGEPFGRPADCERHMKHVHGQRKLCDKFPCSYSPCLNGRHLEENAFTRKDHYRDHLRDFHQEDIGAAKGEKNARTEEDRRKWQKEQEKWIASRKIHASHWRCVKCLVKKYVAKHGWHCAECNQTCEQERIDARSTLPFREDAQPVMDGGMVTEEQQQSYMQCAESCRTCFGNLWVDNGYGDWDPCSTCNYQETRIGARSFR